MISPRLGAHPIFALLLMVLVWQSKSFFTARGAADFLNTLPQPRGLEAKVTCDQLCYVVYRAEKDIDLVAPEIEAPGKAQ